MAIFFTTVKILYNVGVLQLLPPLLRLIEPVRRGQHISSTLIRNEHAYYCCIAQSLARQTPPLLLTRQPEHPVVIICGDSHSQSPAWQMVDIAGDLHLLRPALVTGLKVRRPFVGVASILAACTVLCRYYASVVPVFGLADFAVLKSFGDFLSSP